MYCQNCGAKNPDDARFCAKCGGLMDEAQAPQTQQSTEQYVEQQTQYQYQQTEQYTSEQQWQQAEQYPAEQQWQQAEQYPAQQQWQQPEQYPAQQWQQPEQYPAEQQNYQMQPGGYYQPPARQLSTNRSLAKYFFLSIVTFGIYGIVVMTNVSTSINTAAGRYDGQKTMNYCLVFFLFSWLTFGILPLIWYHKLSARVGRELRRRNIRHNFGAKDFWLWGVLGSFIIAGPFIYYHKLFKGMNLICRDYNQVG